MSKPTREECADRMGQMAGAAMPGSLGDVMNQATAAYLREDACWKRGCEGLYDPASGKPCWCSGCCRELLAEGRTLAPATEQERRDAKAMQAVIISGMKRP